LVIAIAGAHGKSTTTALAGLVLEAAGLDPTVIVGALVPKWQASARFGRSRYFVIEADEYNLNFLNYSPSIIILNNIEFDHPEYFENFEEFKTAFKKFIKGLVGVKILIANKNDKGVMKVVREMRESGEMKGVEVRFYSNEKRVKNKSNNFTLKLWGEHNRSNALGVIELAKFLKIKKEIWGKVFASFEGLGRRMELVGEIGKIKVFDDYAVHPTAITATLTALKQKCPRAKIWAIFEPHQYSRLQLFIKNFARSLSKADRVIVTKAYAGREKNLERVKETDLVELIGSKARFVGDFERIAEMVKEEVWGGGVVVVFGAGESYQIPRLIEEKILGIERGVRLAKYMTFKIGGQADYFAEAEDEGRIRELINWANRKKIAYFILGGGSNLLVADEGYRGLAIKLKNAKIKIKNAKVYCEAGVRLSELVQAVAKRGLAGLEFAAGIPGTVGGAVRGNAGAWQQSFGDLVVRVKILDEKGNFRWLRKRECNFAYRESRFKKTSEAIVTVELKLKIGNREEIEKRIENNLTKRSSQPKEPSAGCVFVNPPTAAAGQLIDQCGLKGRRVGGAMVSERHANFIVNMGGATAKEVVRLIEVVKTSVKGKFGIELKEEIQLIGLVKEANG
jgi:UDP-N-acetylmuramate--L-alanine ligase/UDP-N-acetylenolpyruvoylglucosamine reductase